MKRRIAAIAMLGLAACATPYDMQEVEAVRDYVAASDLGEVDEIRYFSQFSYRYVNDYYVTVPTRRGDYLVEFGQRCENLRRREFRQDMFDKRESTNKIRARFDTIRGCRIAKIYEISELQRVELHDLGDAPGDEVYLPEDEDS